MGLFSGAKAQITGQKAYRAHIAANELASGGKPEEAAAKYREVLAQYEFALSQSRLPPNIQLGYAILLVRLGRFEEAMRQMEQTRLDKAMKEADWFDLRLNYSVCLWRLGRLEDAIATAKRAAQIKKPAALYNTLGMYLVEQAEKTGDFAEAEAFNAEAMDYDDEDPGILDNMGMLCEARAKFADDPAPDREKAKEYYAKAHKIKPRQITTMYNLARLYHEDGQDDLARETLEPAENLYFSAITAVTPEMMGELKKALGI